MHLKSLIANNGFLIIIALSIGIATGASYRPKEITYILLGTIMALSVTGIDFHKIREKGKRGLAIPIVLVYGFSILMTVIPAYILIDNQDFLHGFIVMAIVPSAVSLIAFTRILDGDVELALAGTGSVYLSSLFIMPVLGGILLGRDVSALSLLNSILLLVLIPFAFSRVLVRLNMDERLGEKKKAITGILFFFLVLNIVGARRDAFFLEPSVIGLIGIICVLRSSVAGTIIYFVSRKLCVDEGEARTYVLFGAFKNGAFAVALSVTLFNPAAAVPAAVSIVFDMASISYYELLFSKFSKKFLLDM